MKNKKKIYRWILVCLILLTLWGLRKIFVKSFWIVDSGASIGKVEYTIQECKNIGGEAMVVNGMPSGEEQKCLNSGRKIKGILTNTIEGGICCK